MTRCSECKHWIPKKNDNIIGVCEQYDCPISAIGGVTTYDDMSCTHAERRDGLKECCATCRHIMNNACLQGYHCTGNIVLEKMLCPEWQPREEER